MTAGNWVLYLLECAGGSTYAGITNDLPARWAAHRAGRGARYTRMHRPLKVLGVEAHADRAAASRAEHALKSLAPADKRRWATANPPSAALRLALCAEPAAD